MAVTIDLTGRQAVVTGGAGGLGRSIALRLEACGASITVIDLPAALAAAPGRWRQEAIDLASAESMAALARLGDELDRVDIVVANAGVVPPWRRMAELDGGEWAQVSAINVWGVAATIGGLAPALGRSGRGSVIAMSSLNGRRAHPRQALYTASKHAVIGIVSRIDARHAGGGPDQASALAAMAGQTALGRIATEADIAELACFLASDLSAAMTGLVLPVDGGTG
jgi:NAD(P)-dependent dehydrogenase (short-subunit alcohol dehydrogenase family)